MDNILQLVQDTPLFAAILRSQSVLLGYPFACILTCCVMDHDLQDLVTSRLLQEPNVGVFIYTICLGNRGEMVVWMYIVRRSAYGLSVILLIRARNAMQLYKERPSFTYSNFCTARQLRRSQ